MIAYYFKQLFYKAIIHKWELAFIETPIDDVLQGKKLDFRYVKHQYRNRWFADPFILSFNEQEIRLLVEDYSDRDRLGKISRLIIDRYSYEVKDVKIVLSLETHLSFPAIKRENGKIYIYPENNKAGGLWLYEYDFEEEKCKEVKRLCDDPLTDAIQTNLFGSSLIFSTREPAPNSNILNIYSSVNDVFSNVTQIVSFEENIARNAGDFFEFKGEYYRPAQVCNDAYGQAVSLQKITGFINNFNFEEVRRIYPPNSAFGLHTFNVYKDMIVVDIRVFRYPWIAIPIYALYRKIR